MGFFSDFLFNQFPARYKRDDTNKDIDPLNQDRGTFERFLEIFGIELDEEIIPKIEEFLDNIDIITCDDKFINEIAYQLGNPPDIFDLVDDYRRILRYAVAIYKIKGTKASYELFFAILGYLAIITEIQPEEVFRDTGRIRDDSPILLRDSNCLPCSDYDISFSSIAGPTTPLDQTTLDKLREAIYFVEPINAKLRYLIAALSFSDVAEYCCREDINISLISPARRDTGLLRDDSNLRDSGIVTPEPEIVVTCNNLLEGVDYWEIENDFIIQ